VKKGRIRYSRCPGEGIVRKAKKKIVACDEVRWVKIGSINSAPGDAHRRAARGISENPEKGGRGTQSHFNCWKPARVGGK